MTVTALRPNPFRVGLQQGHLFPGPRPSKASAVTAWRLLSLNCAILLPAVMISATDQQDRNSCAACGNREEEEQEQDDEADDDDDGDDRRVTTSAVATMMSIMTNTKMAMISSLPPQNDAKTDPMRCHEILAYLLEAAKGTS